MKRDDMQPSGQEWSGNREGLGRVGRHGDFLDWNLWGSWPRMFKRNVEPTVDMYETEKEVIVEADVPGYEPDRISIKVSPESLTMRGDLESNREEDREGYYLREREFGQFQRTIRFPAEVKADQAVAKYRDGVLKVTAPKVTEGTNGSRDLHIERE